MSYTLLLSMSVLSITVMLADAVVTVAKSNWTLRKDLLCSGHAIGAKLSQGVSHSQGHPLI